MGRRMELTFRDVRAVMAGLAIASVAANQSAYAVVRAAGRQPGAGSRSVWAGVYTEEQAKRGQAVYREECARCHAETLIGKEPSPPLVGEVFLTAWNKASAADLFEQLRLTMPQDHPGKLSIKQYTEVIAYLFKANQFPTGDKDLDPDLAALKLIQIDQIKP